MLTSFKMRRSILQLAWDTQTCLLIGRDAFNEHRS